MKIDQIADQPEHLWAFDTQQTRSLFAKAVIHCMENYPSNSYKYLAFLFQRYVMRFTS